MTLPHTEGWEEDFEKALGASFRDLSIILQRFATKERADNSITEHKKEITDWVRSLLNTSRTEAYEEGVRDMKHNTLNAFGGFVPVSGADINDLNKLIKTIKDVYGEERYEEGKKDIVKVILKIVKNTRIYSSHGETVAAHNGALEYVIKYLESLLSDYKQTK